MAIIQVIIDDDRPRKNERKNQITDGYRLDLYWIELVLFVLFHLRMTDRIVL